MPISTKSGRRASAWGIASGPEVTVDDYMAHAGEAGAEVKGNNSLILDNESARWPLHRPAAPAHSLDAFLPGSRPSTAAPPKALPHR
jgi:hypothetical protein